MEKRTLGKTGISVSVLGYGSSELGYESVSQRTIGTLLNAALDAGLNVIDTAACYGDAEEMIGSAISHRRAEYHILTKCGHAGGLRLSDWSPELVEKSIERSLKRLRTDRLDLVQLHSCGEEVLRRGEVTEALKRVRDKGMTRFIGYSGDGAAALWAVRSGQFDTLQISVSVADQEAIDGPIAEAKERGMGVIAKRPLANASWLTSAGAVDWYFRPYRDRLQELDYDFLRADPKTSVAVALRFTLSVAGVTTAIVGTTKPGRWKENAALLEAGPLHPAEYDAIRSRWRAIAPPEWVGLR